MGRPILSPGKKLTGEKTDRYTGQHHIPESTFNYQKALKKYMQGDVFIARDYYIVHMANKRYTYMYVLRISILLLKWLFIKH